MRRWVDATSGLPISVTIGLLADKNLSFLPLSINLLFRSSAHPTSSLVPPSPPSSSSLPPPPQSSPQPHWSDPHGLQQRWHRRPLQQIRLRRSPPPLPGVGGSGSGGVHSVGEGWNSGGERVAREALQLTLAVFCVFQTILCPNESDRN